MEKRVLVGLAGGRLVQPHRNDVEEAILSAFELVAANRGIELETASISHSEPVDLDPAMIELLGRMAAATGPAYRRIPSGGGHDAMNFQKIGVPTGMLFVPSVDGISHNPEEETSSEAIRDAPELLARTMLRGPQ